MRNNAILLVERKKKKKIEFCCLKGEIRKYLKSRSRSSKFVKKDARGE